MKSIRLPVKILQTLIKDRLYHPGRLIADTIILATRCGLLLVLYAYVFGLRGGVISGVTYGVAAWNIFFYFMFSMLDTREIAHLIMQDVRSGNVETLLGKPVSYLWYRIWWQLGSGLYSFFVTSTVGILALTVFVGLPDTLRTPLFEPTFLLAFIGSVMLSLALYGIVGLLAFWMEEINPVFWIVDKTVMVFGGAYLPVALFPHFMYQFAAYSPFGASRLVSHTAYASWGASWPSLIGIQYAWVVMLTLVCWWMFTKAKKKISINGG